MTNRIGMTTPRRIVIADDEAVIRMGVRCILEDAGHAIVGEASTGTEALGLVPDLSPDLVLLDIRIPAPDGIEVARRLKADAPAPVIFLTAFSDRKLLAAAAEAGGYAYIVKPVHERALLAAVEMAGARWRELAALKDALETRKLVERAKGILMSVLGLSENDAYHLLHHRSRTLRRPMREVAREVLASDQTIRHYQARKSIR